MSGESAGFLFPNFLVRPDSANGTALWCRKTEGMITNIFSPFPVYYHIILGRLGYLGSYKNTEN